MLGAALESELTALSGRRIAMIDSAHAIADEVAEVVAAKQMATERDDPGKLRIIVTDKADDFEAMATQFLGRRVAGIPVTAIDL